MRPSTELLLRAPAISLMLAGSIPQDEDRREVQASEFLRASILEASDRFNLSGAAS